VDEAQGGLGLGGSVLIYPLYAYTVSVAMFSTSDPATYNDSVNWGRESETGVLTLTTPDPVTEKVDQQAMHFLFLVLEDLVSGVAKILQGTLQLSLSGSVLGSSKRLDLRWWATDKGPYFVVAFGEQPRKHVGGDKAALACIVNEGLAKLKTSFTLPAFGLLVQDVFDTEPVWVLGC
jgi:hypothetical protein